MRNENRRGPSNNCPKCGSHNWQAIETAYQQSVRKNERGYESRSLFAETIAPPERRSTVGSPMFTFIGLFCGAIVILPEFLPGPIDTPHLMLRMYDPEVYIPALVIGLVAAFIQGVAAVSYNSITWAAEYRKWQDNRVCRNCSKVYRAPIGHRGS